MEMEFTGAIEQEPKEQDFRLGSVTSQGSIPDVFRTDYDGEVYHQKKTTSCGAHAGVYIKNIQEGRNHSPAYLWKRIKQTDGFPILEGTTMEAIFKTLRNRGVCSINLLPNTTNDSHEEYANPSAITLDMDSDALKSRISTFAYEWSPSFYEIKKAIYEFGAVMLLIRIGKEWWTPSWDGNKILPLDPTTEPTSGHFVTAIGYNEDTIFFVNAWGKTWGYGGFGEFKEDYVHRVIQMGTCFDYVDVLPFVFKRTLKRGMSGTDVGMLQKILQDKGFFTQKITSYFGSVTEKAVKDFQKSMVLKADGIVGPKTIKALSL